jgi:hypothetical protein
MLIFLNELSRRKEFLWIDHYQLLGKRAQIITEAGLEPLCLVII